MNEQQKTTISGLEKDQRSVKGRHANEIQKLTRAYQATERCNARETNRVSMFDTQVSHQMSLGYLPCVDQGIMRDKISDIVAKKTSLRFPGPDDLRYTGPSLQIIAPAGPPLPSPKTSLACCSDLSLFLIVLMHPVVGVFLLCPK